MRILDLGCGRAMSSIFLHREFGVEVWATDLWFNATDNLQCVRDAGISEGVHPIHAEAHALPFAAEFFDAIVSIDSFPYYGTDDTYAHYLARLVKPGGVIAIAGAGLTKEFSGEVPATLRGWWEPIMACLHTHEWWQRHWYRSGILEVTYADSMPDAWQHWLQWQRAIAPENRAEIEALERDRGANLTYVRAVARRRADITLDGASVGLWHIRVRGRARPEDYAPPGESLTDPYQHRVRGLVSEPILTVGQCSSSAC
jgi:cyclopropane fatty-acyl-phospholipid synthase-like methyltransferase